ncbi:MAG: helix-turn-helix transcriptional regulator [Clostridiales bacterium]
MQENIVLTPQEVADMLKIAKNTVYEIIKRGELNSYRVGKKVRVDLKDVEDYKNKTKSIKTNNNDNTSPQNIIFYDDISPLSGFVICGQDILLDILSRHLQMHSDGMQSMRSYIGSYNGLFELYHGKVQIATTHLWDGETGIYNIPYVKRLLPGVSTIIIHLASRLQGFYVPKGNPKNLKNWNDLKRKDITIINREKGSGTRILLDEHLKILNIDSSKIKGYNREITSHLAIASSISRGGADIGIGIESSASQVKGVDFIPLQTEDLDIVIKKSDAKKLPYKTILNILNSKEFKMEVEGIEGYDTNNLGKIIAET